MPVILRVGIDDAPPIPMQIGSPETGDFRGFEVDVLEQIAKRLSLALHYHRAFWSVIVRELAAGNLDIVCSAATITEERTREVDFCVPHLRQALATVKRAGIPSGLPLSALRLGVRAGTTAETYARDRGVTQFAQVSESNEELYAALASGAFDAIIDDSPIARHFSRAHSQLRFGDILPDSQGAYAIMVRKGEDALRERINIVLNDMERDGTLRDLRQKWFRGERLT